MKRKLSELMLEGYAKVGHQTKNKLFTGTRTNPKSVCALGAVCFAKYGDAKNLDYAIDVAHQTFADSVGVSIVVLNDEGMSIPDIAGIAAAEGL